MQQNLHWVSYNPKAGRNDSQQRFLQNSFLSRTKTRRKYERLRLGPSLAVDWEPARSHHGHNELPSSPPKLSPDDVLPLGISRQDLPKSATATSNRHRFEDNDHDSSAMVAAENRYITSNPIEPFGAMAVEIKPEWYTGLDYWIHGFDPAICRQQRAAGIYDSSRAEHFALRFRHEALFHATMAVAYNSFDKLSQSYDAKAPSTRVLYHRGKALSSLSTQITSLRVRSAVILQTILNLMVVDSTWLDFDSLSKHQIGLRGLERLELEDPVWSGILIRLMKTSIRTNQQYLWLTMNGYNTVISNNTIDQHLSYPNHPFGIDFCEKISRIPIAFQELALAQRLNAELVAIMASLARFLEIFSKKPSDEEERNYLLTWDTTTYLHQLARLPSRMKLLKKAVYPLEAIICFALSCFITYLSHIMSTGDLWERKKLNLVLSLSFPELEDGGDDILNWCRVLALTLCAEAKRTTAYTVILKEVQRCRLFDLEWEEIVSNLQNHFWLPEFEESARRAWIKARSEAGKDFKDSS